MNISFKILFWLITFFCHTIGLGNEYLDVAKYALWTRQSSTYKSFSSNLGVDGLLNTCSISNTSKNNRWVIKLNDTFVISKLRIYSGNTNFGSHMEIYISKDSDGGTFCNFGRDFDASNFVHDVICFNGPTRGNMVTIKNTFVGDIKLCELEILVCKDYFFGVECAKKCNCDMNLTCSKFDGACPALCSPGFTGLDCQLTCSNKNFGASCKKLCHCAIGSECDPVRGICNPPSCQENYFGSTCQTILPHMLSEPSIYSLNDSSVTITWPSINQKISDDDNVIIEYLVMYKLLESNEASIFEIGPRVVHNALLFNHRATINNLRFNSFYEFQIVPLLTEFNQDHVLKKDVSGIASPCSGLIRTKCLAPIVPNITECIYSVFDKDGEFQPMMTVSWTILTPEQSNCDNILFYEIFYEESNAKSDSVVVHKTGARKEEGSKNLTIGLKFKMRYKIRVAAHNNYPLESSSLPIFITIGLQPEIGWLSANIIKVNSEVFIISIVVLSASLFAICITVIFLCRLNHTRKKKKVPTATLR